MVPIPVHIWEVIRRYEGVNLCWAGKTDAQILQYVEREVDERIERYRSEESERGKHLIALLGRLPFGGADEPREEQIASGLAYFRQMRDHQDQIKRAIEDLERTNSRR